MTQDGPLRVPAGGAAAGVGASGPSFGVAGDGALASAGAGAGVGAGVAGAGGEERFWSGVRGRTPGPRGGAEGDGGVAAASGEGVAPEASSGVDTAKDNFNKS